jgi:osmotically-inducible protein OsmY
VKYAGTNRKKKGSWKMKTLNKIPIKIGAAFVIVVLTLLVGTPPARAKTSPGDESINLWVKDALFEDARVPSAKINVSTSNGIVKMTGSVDNLAAKLYAGKEATKIKGVRGVVNEITVNAPFRYDFDIAQDVLKRILNSSTIESDDIDVTVSGGKVSLTGSVTSWAEASQAELLATETRGVRAITNNLVAIYSKQRSDKDIQKDAESVLKQDIYLTGLPIKVSVKDGVVTLTGEVGTAYQKERATSNVRWIWNVTDVKNNLKVEWWDNDGTRLTPAVPTDSELSQTVKDEIYQDLRVSDPWDINVTAFAGHVTLGGKVNTLHEKNIADKDAKNVVGVAWVTDRIDVNKKPRSDSAILNDVLFEIDTDYLLDPEVVTAKVRNGVVTLDGNVNDFWEKGHADEVASRVAGVQKVVNNIRVNYASEYSDASLRQRIKDRMAAGAETMWIADNIKVAVKNGKATLTGKVNYWSEYDAAEYIAYHTTGVWAVVNKLTVRGYDNYKWDEYAYPWPDTYGYDFYYPGYLHYDWWW